MRGPPEPGFAPQRGSNHSAFPKTDGLSLSFRRLERHPGRIGSRRIQLACSASVSQATSPPHPVRRTGLSFTYLNGFT